MFVLIMASCCLQGHSQAALLMEEPYGFFGTLNPTGHVAIYFEHICAETPVKLRRCLPGELGSVITRYQGIDEYDWLAVPLLPYLYAVEDSTDIPTHVNHSMVNQLRNRYRKTRLKNLSANLSPGSFMHGGWTQLVGVAYDRRTYAFRFETTSEQDDTLIQQMNASSNHTSFNLLFNNCADFSRILLNHYFPHTFRRGIMTTPKQTAYRLVQYARKHPEIQLMVFEIPQIPGYRRESHPAKGIDVDYFMRGRYHFIPKHPEIFDPNALEIRY